MLLYLDKMVFTFTFLSMDHQFCFNQINGEIYLVITESFAKLKA